MRGAASMVLLGLSLVSVSLGEGLQSPVGGSDPVPTRVLLIGASVGKAWDFPGLPDRTGLDGYLCEYVGRSAFDKGPLLRRVLAREVDRPDIIILKECAAYFPGDLETYRNLVIGWIDACIESGVMPVPATVLPVAAPQTIQKKLRRLVRTHLLGRRDRTEEIARYNDWLKEYTDARGLEIIDLESIVRVSASDRSLRKDLHSGDGLHLNERAYTILDGAALDLLSRLERREG